MKSFASPAGGLRNCNAAELASFKKYSPAADFLNPACGVTEPNKAAMQLLVER
jgi:hypothetical protein